MDTRVSSIHSSQNGLQLPEAVLPPEAYLGTWDLPS
jgi:hypothetical protein